MPETLAGADELIATGDEVAEARLQRAVALEATGAYDDALATADAVIATETSPAVHAEAMGMRAKLIFRRSDFQGALTASEAALAATPDDTPPDRDPRIPILIVQANAYAYLDRYSEALGCCERAAAIARSTRNRWGIGEALNELAVIRYYRGEFALAEAANREALAIRREIGDRFGIPRTQGNLGIIAMDRGHYDDAVALVSEARAQFAAIGARMAAVGADGHLSKILAHQGKAQEAQALAATVIVVGRERGAAYLELEHELVLGESLGFEGDLDGARAAFARALAISESRDFAWGVACSLLCRSELELPHDPARGEADPRRALEIWHRLGLAAFEAGAAAAVARSIASRGGIAEAERMVERACSLLGACDILIYWLSVHAARAEIALGRGDREAALAIIDEALALAARHGAGGLGRPIERTRRRIAAA